MESLYGFDGISYYILCIWVRSLFWIEAIIFIYHQGGKCTSYNDGTELCLYLLVTLDVLKVTQKSWDISLRSVLQNIHLFGTTVLPRTEIQITERKYSRRTDIYIYVLLLFQKSYSEGWYYIVFFFSFKAPKDNYRVNVTPRNINWLFSLIKNVSIS